MTALPHCVVPLFLCPFFSPFYLSLSLSPSFTLFPSYFPSSFSPVLSQLPPPPSLALPPSTVLHFPHASLPLLTSFEVFLATKNVFIHQGFPVIFVRELKKLVSKPTSGIFFSGLAGSSLLNILEGRTRKTHFDSGFMETS